LTLHYGIEIKKARKARKSYEAHRKESIFKGRCQKIKVLNWRRQEMFLGGIKVIAHLKMSSDNILKESRFGDISDRE